MREVPPGWLLATVGDVATLTDGPFGSNLKTSHYTEDGPRVVRLQNIGSGVFRDERAHIAQEHFERLQKHEVVPGDVVAASLGDEAPRACLIPAWLGPAVVKADCIRVRVDAYVDPGFVMWILNSPPIRQQATASIKGVGRPRLGLGGIKRLSLPVPPLKEQRRIVAAIEEQLSRLDAADTSLAAARRRVNSLVRQILAISTFEQSSGVPLGDVAEVVRGVTYKKEQSLRNAAPGYVPILRATNVGDALMLDDELVFVVDSVVRDEQMLQVGDVVVATSSGSASVVGKSAILKEPWHGSFGAFCAVLRARPGVEPSYLSLAVRDPAVRKRWSTLASGTNINNLKRSHITETSVPLPPLEEQRRIVAEVEERLSVIDAMRASIERAERRSATLRRSILERAFRGELVPQDPSDEPASVLLERIRAAREARPVAAGRRRKSQ